MPKTLETYVQTDMRNHPLFRQAEALTRDWLRPGTGLPTTIGQLAASPDGRRVAAAATVCDSLSDGAPSTRIAVVDLASGDLDILTHGPCSDSLPQWSPDGRHIAFRSDRHEAGINRLRLLDPALGEDRTTPDVPGFVESIEWSADGGSILLGIAGYGSDVSGVQGAFSVHVDDDRPDWAPTVEGAPEATPWRSAWIYDLATDSVRQVTPEGLNIWRVAWCGAGHVVALCSDHPEETWWYSADLRLIDMATAAVRPLFQPGDQLGSLAVSPSGATVAVVEAVCSDRTLEAGNVRLIDVASGAVSHAATLGADAVQLIWRDEEKLLFVAAHGPETVVGLCDRGAGDSREIWRGVEWTPGGSALPEIAALGADAQDFLFVGESFFHAPALIAAGFQGERIIRHFGTPETEARVRDLGSARDFSWTAPDGLEIHGWLVTPSGPGPHPVIMQVHGGPIWYTRPVYVGRSALAQMALASGYALFQPNPRGSSGRGQDFARRVVRDMGGADTLDYLSGLDALEAAGLIDPARIGVTGYSYGGYMSAWLITQDPRFAAAVPEAPISNWVSEYLTCHIASFCDLFLEGRTDSPDGQYFSRSPIHFAHRVKTPTLLITGSLDKVTPSGQAIEFHHALQNNTVESMLVTYPQEGHGVSNMPAIFDYTARVIYWFMKHMPAPG
jgi:dipeptidyl aminopeptidase/acylaminoacyl peptidase